MEDKLTFCKRIQLTKKEVFNCLQDIELDKTANSKSGYYSLKSIINSLNTIIDKYDLDLDLSIKENEVIAIWYDCIDEKTRTSVIDISKIKEVKRLPSMTNEVQSMGACITYVRRYAYTVVLGLNATDKLENNTSNSRNNTQNYRNNTQQQQPQKKKISKDQLTFLKVKSIIKQISKGDKAREEQLLRLATRFTAKDTGKIVEGIDDWTKLSIERARVIYGQYKTSNKDLVEKVKENLNKIYYVEE